MYRAVVNTEEPMGESTKGTCLNNRSLRYPQAGTPITFPILALWCASYYNILVFLPLFNHVFP